MSSENSLGLKERNAMYRLIISQLFYDGHQSLAVNLSSLVKAYPACPPSDRLLKVVTLGLREEEEHAEKSDDRVKTAVSLINDTCLDLEFETDAKSISPDAAQYETCYVTAHKGPCRAGVFHPRGNFIATGSEDASIKILDVDRMLAKSGTMGDLLPPDMGPQQMENHPVVRTLYDHLGEVTSLDFHPTAQLLVSGSKDFTVRLFDYSKASVKKAQRTIAEAAEVRSVHFHPTGDYLLVGTQQPTVRLYDVTTQQCFVSSNPEDQHVGPITSLKWSPNARNFVTASKDGDIKIWDGVSNKCVNTFKKAHDGAEVCSVVFSKNSKYVLSSGKDSLVKLWELATSRCIIVYTGAGATGKQQHRTQAVFNHNEDYVFFPDEKTTSLCCWDARNADRQKLLSLGHNSVVKVIVHSPVAPGFITCSDDYRARFWYRRES